jgi:hypothetical protein
VTRPRSRAPGHPDPVYRRSRLLLPILLAAVVSACIGSNTPAAAPSSGSAAPAATAASGPPSSPPSPSSAPSSEAPETAAPTPTATPTAGTSAGASPSEGAAAVDGCTGNDDNRAFLANAAGRYDWPVYCAALPARWFVGTGSFGSGKLDISYKGPGGARFELHEGAICAAGVDCLPTGTDLGTTGFGDQIAAIIRVEDGGLAASVHRGQRISWLAIGQGMDETAFRSILGALIRLD